jgi:hypothetical protein
LQTSQVTETTTKDHQKVIHDLGSSEEILINYSVGFHIIFFPLLISVPKLWWWKEDMSPRRENQRCESFVVVITFAFFFLLILHIVAKVKPKHKRFTGKVINIFLGSPTFLRVFSLPSDFHVGDLLWKGK